MTAAEYFKYKQSLIPEIMTAYNRLDAENDIIVIEGAGSPAEINLKQNDIVNMGMARLAKAPVLLIGDIDPGGIFAQIAGTLMLLTDSERSYVKATVINKFRGDIELLRPGLRMLSDITNKPVAGVLPMLDIDIDEEDSQSRRLTSSKKSALDIAVIRLPRMSNYTDFSALDASGGVSVRYVKSPQELKNPDLLILPGTKSTISDLRWLKACGLAASLKLLAAAGTPVIGICGGYQMLGESITDNAGSEGGGIAGGLGLLPVTTEFSSQKHCLRASGRVLSSGSALSGLSGALVEGYEIHMGETTLKNEAAPFLQLADGRADGCVCGSVLGTYLHGLFDEDDFRKRLLFSLCERRGLPRGSVKVEPYSAHRQRQYDKLAHAIRKNLDMDMIYNILEAGI